jgi:hypothetical protein
MMINRRSMFKMLAGLPFLGFLKEQPKPKEITDSDILDCLVYAREHVEEGLIYMSTGMSEALLKRFWIDDGGPLEGIATGIGDIDVEVVDNIDWGDGPEYTCWLTVRKDADNS